MFTSSNKPAPAIIGILLYSLFTVCHLTAQTVVITADKDNSIYSENGSLSNGMSAYLYVGRTGSHANNAVRRSLLHFNLASIPANVTITAVTLSMYCNNLPSGSASGGINLHRLLNDWGEAASGTGSTGGSGSPASTTDATWTSRFYNTTLWTTPGGDFLPTLSGGVLVNQEGLVQISTQQMIGDVQNWLNNAAVNFGWAMVGPDEITTNSARRYASRETTLASQRPTLMVTYTSVLPVTLHSFSVMLQQQHALLSWVTSSEINNDYFNIEHSTNGSNFAVIGQVKGSGTSPLQHDYSFLHAGIPLGKNYYRLAQVDANGHTKYSPVQLVIKTNKHQVRIAPNPVNNSFTVLSTQNLQGKTYSIYTQAGTLILSGVIGSKPISVRQLSSGTYYVLIKSNDFIETHTLIKK